jgi:hypothetical protein
MLAALTHLTHLSVMSAITWDPFIRGVVITAIFILVFPGSVYLLLATNTGVRVGFLVAAAGFVGLLAVLSILWMILGSTAAVGRPNSWKPLAVVTGNFTDQVTVAGVKDLPVNNLNGLSPIPGSLKTQHWYWPLQSCPPNSGWHKLSPAQLTSVTAAGDLVLAPSSGATAKTQLTSPFSSASDYGYADAFDKNPNGGCLFAISRHKVYLPFGRGTHYVIVRAFPAVPGSAAVGTPKPDTTKTPTYVILERNLGSVHQPQAVVAICSLLVFAIICNSLHRRDKESWARQEAEKAAAAGGAGGPDREKVGAAT